MSVEEWRLFLSASRFYAYVQVVTEDFLFFVCCLDFFIHKVGPCVHKNVQRCFCSVLGGSVDEGEQRALPGGGNVYIHLSNL